jgi:hypothetical protein
LQGVNSESREAAVPENAMQQRKLAVADEQYLSEEEEQRRLMRAQRFAGGMQTGTDTRFILLAPRP